jgi:hypothetical protein
MPVATKKRPPLEMEPGEGKLHESAESAAEETREGAEPDDAPKGKTNRKRSAKGVKSTKAPMDGDCGCGGGKAKKCTCDGGCGGYAKKMDRSDALTPQEYLAACDLGIQGRSRSYIRARLDAAERLDLKCGKGSISPGEKCTKGAAQQVAPRKKRSGLKGGAKIRGLKTAAKIAGAAALIGGAAYMQQTARRNTLERRSLASPSSAAGAAFLAERVKNNMSQKAVSNLRARAVMNARARAWAKRDSIWAEGFQP